MEATHMLILALINFYLHTAESIEALLESNKASQVLIQPHETSGLLLKDFDHKTHFVVVQIHAQKNAVSISSSPEFSPSVTKTGTSAGMVTMVPSPIPEEMSWYIRSNSSDNVTALVIANVYAVDAPIPGGCNQVFSLETDPNVVLSFTERVTKVWFQWADLGRDNCENATVLHMLQYKVYVNYLNQNNLDENHFFEGLRKMLTTKDIMKHGFEIFTLHNTASSKSQLRVNSSPGQGTIYSVIVTSSVTGAQAAYVTDVTYSCGWGAGGCEDIAVTAFGILQAIASGVFGIILLFFGHRFFKTSQVLFSLGFSCLLAYILMHLVDDLTDLELWSVTASSGVVGVALWLTLWLGVGLPILNVFLVGLTAGWLVAATLFFTPFGNISWWNTEINYAMAFSCVLLLYTVLLMAYTRALNILSCSIAGAYLLCLSVAIPLRSSVLLVFLNSIYRQTDPSLTGVLVAAPLNALDIILFTCWVVLTIFGMVIQAIREKGRPPFPIPRRLLQKRQHRIPSATRYIVEEEQNIVNEADEQTRLLSAERAYERIISGSLTAPSPIHGSSYHQGSSNYGPIGSSRSHGYGTVNESHAEEESDTVDTRDKHNLVKNTSSLEVRNSENSETDRE